MYLSFLKQHLLIHFTLFIQLFTKLKLILRKAFYWKANEKVTNVDMYSHNGNFFLKAGQFITDKSNVSDLPCVILIYQLKKGHIDLVYIGTTDAGNLSGKFNRKLPMGRVSGKENVEKQRLFFDNKLQKSKADAYDIYWYVTSDKEIQHAPAQIEDVILKRYFEIYGCLPEWNK